jgi:allantoin racemase
MTEVWFQVLSSRTKTPEMFDAMQKHLDSVANPGTIVNLQGTAVGGFADQYSAFLHLDGSRVLTSSLENAANGFTADVYAMANSLDPGVPGLREILDVPVLTLMEVACSLAPSFGDRYGFLVANRRLRHHYRDLVAAYGLEAKLGGIDHLGYDRILDMRKVFVGDQSEVDACMGAVEAGFERLGRSGVEVAFVAGPVGALLSGSGVTELSGVRYLDALGLLLKVSEGVAGLSGLTTSRFHRYAQPPVSLLREALAEYDLSFP